jgi:hypothetical protein
MKCLLVLFLRLQEITLWCVLLMHLCAHAYSCWWHQCVAGGWSCLLHLPMANTCVVVGAAAQARDDLVACLKWRTENNVAELVSSTRPRSDVFFTVTGASAASGKGSVAVINVKRATAANATAVLAGIESAFAQAVGATLFLTLCCLIFCVAGLFHARPSLRSRPCRLLLMYPV